MKKRRFDRKLYAKAGSYDVNTPDGGIESLEAEFLNVSSGGACIRTARGHRPGSVILLKFELDVSSVRIPCLAEVRWAHGDNNRYRVGLQFLS